jgi:hypothetical protein
MDLAAVLALILALKPVIHTAIHAKGGDLDDGGANEIRSSHIFVEHIDVQVVADVLDGDLDGLVPLGRLARVLHDFGLEGLVAASDLAKGVHFAEEVRVALEFGLDDG